MVMVISSTKFGVANQEQCLSVDQNSIILWKKKSPPYLEMLFYIWFSGHSYLYHVISCYIMLFILILFIIVNPTMNRWRSWDHGNTHSAWLAGRMLWQGLVEACRVPHVQKPVQPVPSHGASQQGRDLSWWKKGKIYGEMDVIYLWKIAFLKGDRLILVSPRNSGGCPLYLGHVGVCREKTRRDSSCCLCNWANTTTLSFHSKSKWRSFSCLCWQLLRSRPPEYPRHANQILSLTQLISRLFRSFWV